MWPKPKSDSDQALANQFMKFFDDKTKKIHSNLTLSIEEDGSEEYDALMVRSPVPSPSSKLDIFGEAGKEEVRKIIVESANKQCPLDPIPTWLLKILLDILLPIIMLIINKSLFLAEVPVLLKTALLKPLIKDDWNDNPSYRPVSTYHIYQN